ncbi:MAG: MFS transporter [Thermoflexales bacterium]|nr:MFS transporter [Thermoflexales bacterium]
MASDTQPTDNIDQKTLKRNVAAFLTDSGGFGGALGFMGYSTVVPSLVMLLTNSEPMVGLVNMLWSGMWLLPQLAAGRWMANRPRKLPVLLGSAVIGRSTVLLFAIALALRLDPTVLFGLMLVMVVVFRGFDAVSAVAWFDIVSKSLPLNIRGRILGWTQAVAFVLQFGTSFAVTWALSTAGPSFPGNYALLIGLSAVGLLVSFVALLFIREPHGEVADNVSGQMKMGAHARHILSHDRAFRQSSIARVLAGGIALAIPFYAVHAIKYLHLPEGLLGGLLAAQTIGGVISALVLGPISERYGSRIVIRITLCLALIPPALGVLLNLIGPGGGALLTVGNVLIFAAIGATDGSFLLGFLQYIMEIAPAVERTAYTGLANTIGGVTVVASLIGGVLLQATSYPVLFIAAALGPAIGLAVVWRLPKAERRD